MKIRLWYTFFSFVVLVHSRPLFGEDGATLYQKHCAACHDQISPRIPPRRALQKMSASRILRTLDFGLMMNIAYPLRREEREAIAKFLGTGTEEVPFSTSAFCSDKQMPISSKPSRSWTGWSPTFSNTRFQSSEAGALTASQVLNLKLKWAFGFPGDITAFGAPTVQGDVLFTGSAGGSVYAMNTKTGCLYWMFQANGPVRAAPLIVQSGTGYSILFGDQVGWFYAIGAATGKLIWKNRIDHHEATRLTGSAVFDEGVVFVPAASWEETRAVSVDYPCCTFRGSISALRVMDGSPIWKTFLVAPPKKVANSSFGPSGAPVWSAPTIDKKRGLLYVTTGDNYSSPATITSDAIIALDMKTGQIVWSKQVTSEDIFNVGCAGSNPNCPKQVGPDFDFGTSAILVSVEGRDLLIAGQKSGMVYAFDPDQKGTILWQTRVGKGGTHGGVMWGIASDSTNVYSAVADEVWKRGNIRNAPVGSADLDPIQGGGLTALRLADGSKVWHAPGHACDPPRPGCSPAQPAALTAISGVVFSGSTDGHIRAFSSKDGHVLWDFDTVRDYSTVNGVPAHGGSLDGAGPVIVDGILYVNSGYPRFGGMPGNVLLAFSVDGK